MKRAPPTLTCEFSGCGRKANNLCPNSLCLAHCHEQTEAGTGQVCKRHEREWDNKQKQGSSRSVRREANIGSVSAVSAASSSSGAAVAAAAASSSSSASARAGAALAGVPLKRVRTEGLESDGFGLLEADAAPPLRKCPKCERLVVDVGSHFLLHVGMCDAAAFSAMAPKESGEKTAPEAQAVVRARRERVERLLEDVLGEKKDEEDEEEEEEQRQELERQRMQLLRDLTAAAERTRDLLQKTAPHPNEEPLAQLQQPSPWTGQTSLLRFGRKTDFIPFESGATYIKLG